MPEITVKNKLNEGRRDEWEEKENILNSVLEVQFTRQAAVILGRERDWHLSENKQPGLRTSEANIWFWIG